MWFFIVSINSTSEEVRSLTVLSLATSPLWFPLIQLPRKSEVVIFCIGFFLGNKFPLIQLPRKSEVILIILAIVLLTNVSINSTSEEVRSNNPIRPTITSGLWFPLIQLPRKSEALDLVGFGVDRYVSINSTSEEVRSSLQPFCPIGVNLQVSINSTSEEVRSSRKLYFWCRPEMFPLIQLPRKSEVRGRELRILHHVSINSTSEEVRSLQCYTHCVFFS